MSEAAACFEQITRTRHEDDWPFVSDVMADVRAHMPHVAERLEGRR